MNNQNLSHKRELSGLITYPHQNDQDDETVPGDNWIEKIKYAFDEVDINHKGVLSFEQWMNSRLGLIVTSEKLADERLQEYFHQIDSNNDGIISWEELVDYLTCQQRCINADTFDRNLNLVNIAPDLTTAHKFRKTTRCLRVIYISYIEQIITLNESSLTFWSRDCQQTHQFTDPEGFIDFCYLACLARLAIATKTRKIIFFDLKGKNKMPFAIKATVDSDDIPKFSLADSKEALLSFKKKNHKPPLFHIPTSICSNPEQPLIYVGNQAGKIEIFSCFASKKMRFAWDAERVKVKALHKNKSVSQISYIPALSSFASSGEDGSIYIWQYDEKTKLFSIGFSFNEPTNVPISSFVFDFRSSSIIYTMPTHFIACWKIFTGQRSSKETPSQMSSVICSVTISEEASFVVTVSENSFVSIFTPPNLELTSNWFMNYHHHLCAPTGSIFIDNHLYLVGNYISSWHCQTADSDGLPPHKHPLLCALANDTFGRIISCDEAGDIYSWNISNGAKKLTFSLTEKDAIVSTLTSDQLMRRLVLGYSNGMIKIVSINSGSVLSDNDEEPVEGGCNCVLFATMLSSKYVVSANGRRGIIFFEDNLGKKMKFVKSYYGHTEQISKIYNIKDTYLLSIGMGNEMFLWNNKLSMPSFRYIIPNDPTVAADLVYTKHLFIVGDVVGYVHIMARKTKNPLKSINIFQMNIKSPISAISISHNRPLIIIGNREGYLKYWKYEENEETKEIEDVNKCGNLIPGTMFCGHTEAIDCISISEKYNLIVSSGRDNEVRIWNINPLKYIGILGKHKKWRIEDPTTFQSMPFDIDDDLFKIVSKKVDYILKSDFLPTNDTNRKVKTVSFDKQHIENVDDQMDKSRETQKHKENNEDEEDTQYVPLTQPNFSLPSATALMEDIEEICVNGRKRAQIVDRLTRVKPSQTVITGRPLMQFGDFRTDIDFENTQKLLRQIRSLGTRRKKKDKKETDDNF